MAYRLNKTGREIEQLLEKVATMESDVYVAPFNTDDIVNALEDGVTGGQRMDLTSLVDAVDAGKVVVIKRDEKVDGIMLGCDRSYNALVYLVSVGRVVEMQFTENIITFKAKEANPFKNASGIPMFRDGGPGLIINAGEWIDYTEIFTTSPITALEFGTLPRILPGESKTLTVYVTNANNMTISSGESVAVLIGVNVKPKSGACKVVATCARGMRGKVYLIVETTAL